MTFGGGDLVYEYVELPQFHSAPSVRKRSLAPEQLLVFTRPGVMGSGYPVAEDAFLGLKSHQRL
jgi:hypothetical protein